MSLNESWDLNKYREEHESDEHWELRRAFMEKWQHEYPEERLVCLARVFANIEILGCRYPTEVMQEVGRRSADIAKEYRNHRRNKLKRTFVLASDAAVDRAKGIKREGGVIVSVPPKSMRLDFVPQTNKSELDTSPQKPQFISFVPQSRFVEDNNTSNSKPQNVNFKEPTNNNEIHKDIDRESSDDDVKTKFIDQSSDDDNKTKFIDRRLYLKDLKEEYLRELTSIKCLSVKQFNDRMFDTDIGKFVLIVRPWSDIPTNLTNSCIACNLLMVQKYKECTFTLTVDGKLLAQVDNNTKMNAKAQACRLVWNKLINNSITLLLKEQFVPRDDTPITMGDMSAKNAFGTPIEDSVALKMMKHMGWKGGGLGADSQGIEEPIKPNLRMVNRAGLGHDASGGLQQLRRAGFALMRGRAATLDADLVFTSEFTAEERAVLHQCASACGLQSKSYGPRGHDRFLVISNKLKPFNIVREVVQRGGETPKYRVFIPETLRTKI